MLFRSYYIDLYSELLNPGKVDVVEAATRLTIGQITATWSNSSLTLTVPLSLIHDDGLLHYGVVVGTLSEATDELTGAFIVPEPNYLSTLGVAAIVIYSLHRARRRARIVIG